MKRLLILPLLFLLTGCFDDQENETAHCYFSAEKALHKRHKAFVLDGTADSMVEMCMERQGYIFKPKQPRCPREDPKAAINPYCYEPKDTLTRILYKLELEIEYL